MRIDEYEKQKVSDELRKMADYLECMPTDEFQMKMDSGRAYLQHFVKDPSADEKKVKVVTLKLYINSRYL